MKVHIARVHEHLFSGEATALSVPTTEGVITVLPHHEPFVTTLKEGSITVRTEKGEQSFPVEGGVLEVSQNQAIVIL